MIATSRHEFLQSIFEDCLKDLIEDYPLFIQCNTLRNALEQKIAQCIEDDLTNIIQNTTRNAINDFSSFISKEGYHIESIHYTLLFNNDVKLYINDEQWKMILNIASSYGFNQDIWHGIPILILDHSRANESIEFIDYSIKCWNMLTNLLATQGYITFYGGELFSNSQNSGNCFSHSAFTISNYQLSDSDDYMNQRFNKSQLDYLAEISGKHCERQIVSDAIATIENLVIC